MSFLTGSLTHCLCLLQMTCQSSLSDTGLTRQRVRGQGDSPGPQQQHRSAPMCRPWTLLSLKEQEGKLAVPGEKGRLFPYIR